VSPNPEVMTKPPTRGPRRASRELIVFYVLVLILAFYGQASGTSNWLIPDDADVPELLVLGALVIAFVLVLELGTVALLRRAEARLRAGDRARVAIVAATLLALGAATLSFVGHWGDSDVERIQSFAFAGTTLLGFTVWTIMSDLRKDPFVVRRGIVRDAVQQFIKNVPIDQKYKNMLIATADYDTIADSVTRDLANEQIANILTQAIAPETWNANAQAEALAAQEEAHRAEVEALSAQHEAEVEELRAAAEAARQEFAERHAAQAQRIEELGEASRSALAGRDQEAARAVDQALAERDGLAEELKQTRQTAAEQIKALNTELERLRPIASRAAALQAKAEEQSAADHRPAPAPTAGGANGSRPASSAETVPVQRPEPREPVGAPTARAAVGSAVPAPRAEAALGTIKEQAFDLWDELLNQELISAETKAPALADLAMSKFPGANRDSLRNYAGQWRRTLSSDESAAEAPKGSHLRAVPNLKG
jgi:hypothetical protein